MWFLRFVIFSLCFAEREARVAEWCLATAHPGLPTYGQCAEAEQGLVPYVVEVKPLVSYGMQIRYVLCALVSGATNYRLQKRRQDIYMGIKWPTNEANYYCICRWRNSTEVC